MRGHYGPVFGSWFARDGSGGFQPVQKLFFRAVVFAFLRPPAFGAFDVGGGVFYNQATGIVENYGKLQVGVLHNYSTVENVNGYATGEKIYNYCGGKVVGLVEIPTQLSC